MDDSDIRYMNKWQQSTCMKRLALLKQLKSTLIFSKNIDMTFIIDFVDVHTYVYV